MNKKLNGFSLSSFSEGLNNVKMITHSYVMVQLILWYN